MSCDMIRASDHLRSIPGAKERCHAAILETYVARCRRSWKASKIQTLLLRLRPTLSLFPKSSADFLILCYVILSATNICRAYYAFRATLYHRRTSQQCGRYHTAIRRSLSSGALAQPLSSNIPPQPMIYVCICMPSSTSTGLPLANIWICV